MSLDSLKAKDLAVGRDFLSWLWYRGEQSGGRWITSQGEPFGMILEGRVMVQSGEGDQVETAVCSGPGTQLHEARIGLSRGKKVHQARLRLDEDGREWLVTIKAEDFGMGGVKTPKVEQKRDEGQDPDGPFLEKMYLLERALFFFDQLFLQFLKLRFSSGWSEEERSMRLWLAGA